MAERLVVAVIGNRNSGKSETWRKLFGYSTRSRYKKLYLYYKKYANVFLVGSSPQERKTPINKIMGTKRPRIVLCAIQYSEDAHNTLQFFADHRYTILAHWLNPGYKDKFTSPYDSRGLVSKILSFNSLFGIRDGRKSAYHRATNLKDFIYGWASRRKLIESD